MLNHTLSSPPPPPPPPGAAHRMTSMTSLPGGSGLSGDHAHYQLPPAPPPPSGHNQPTNGNAGQAWALTQRELEVHQLLQMLKQDADAESAYSGEGSNTDSGRGPSEEGEGPRPHPDHSVSGSYHQHGAHGSRACPEVEESYLGNNSSAQVVPNIPGHSFTSSNFSYSSQPTQLRTFAPQSINNNYSVSTSPSNDFLKKPGVGSAPLRVEDMRPEADFKSTMPPPPPPAYPIDATQLDLETPRSQIGANYIRKFYKASGEAIDAAVAKLGQQNGHDSRMEEVDLSYDDHDDDDDAGGSVQYSCADMSAALHSHVTERSPAQTLQVLETIADDAESTTTTSGSYVVDPQDLVNEIDDLFFRDMMV